MPSTTSILSELQRDFPAIRFLRGDSFRWSPNDQIIYYANSTDTTSLLHEVAHAALGHTSYTYDIELLKAERDAWSMTTTVLAKRYRLPINQEQIETMLDTYRDWLHSRSLCPSCDSTGVQSATNQYSCVACSSRWRVNEARSCQLRRYKIKIAA